MNSSLGSGNTQSRQHITKWWKEVVLILSIYGVYTATRNMFGSAYVNGSDIPLHAFNNAMKIIRLERVIGLFHEESVQQWFLPYRVLIQFLNTYYGTAHFAVTIGVFIVLYRRRKDVFPLFRNALVFTTVLALIGFALFPLMPPRLLDAPCPSNGVGHGGQCIPADLRTYNDANNFGFSDTLKEFGGPWSFDSGGAAKLSNQYAAMPSLHIGWASWCAFGIWPLARRRWLRIAVLLYPALTLLCIVVTGNHYWIDGVGGLVVLGLGFALGARLHYWNQRRLDALFAEIQQRHPSG